MLRSVREELSAVLSAGCCAARDRDVSPRHVAPPTVLATSTSRTGTDLVIQAGPHLARDRGLRIYLLSHLPPARMLKLRSFARYRIGLTDALESRSCAATSPATFGRGPTTALLSPSVSIRHCTVLFLLRSPPCVKVDAGDGLFAGVKVAARERMACERLNEEIVRDIDICVRQPGSSASFGRLRCFFGPHMNGLGGLLSNLWPKAPRPRTFCVQCESCLQFSWRVTRERDNGLRAAFPQDERWTLGRRALRSFAPAAGM